MSCFPQVSFPVQSSVPEWEIQLVFRNGHTIPDGICRIPVPFPIPLLGPEIPYSNSQCSHCSFTFHIPVFNPLLMSTNSTFHSHSPRFFHYNFPNTFFGVSSTAYDFLLRLSVICIGMNWRESDTMWNPQIQHPFDHQSGNSILYSGMRIQFHMKFSVFQFHSQYSFWVKKFHIPIPNAAIAI